MRPSMSIVLTWKSTPMKKRKRSKKLYLTAWIILTSYSYNYCLFLKLYGFTSDNNRLARDDFPNCHIWKWDSWGNIPILQSKTQPIYYSQIVPFVEMVTCSCVSTWKLKQKVKDKVWLQTVCVNRSFLKHYRLVHVLFFVIASNAVLVEMYVVPT